MLNGMANPKNMIFMSALVTIALALTLSLAFGKIVIEGEVVVLTPHDSRPNIPLIWLKISEREIRPLSTVGNIDVGVKTGDIIKVYTSLIPDVPPTALTLDVPIYAEKVDVVLQKSPLDTAELDVKSVTFVLNICGQPAALACSFNATKFSNDSNIVIGPINVPCMGFSSYGQFDSNSCNSASIFGWMSYAESYARDVLKVDITKYNHHIAVLPEVPCNWAGLGTMGCGSACYTWILAKNAKLSTFFHEFGHNLGLMHSSSDGYDYGDASCTMAFTPHVTCFNAAHNALLKWATPVSVISPKANTSFDVRIPGSQRTVRNYVHVLGARRSLYISYRVSYGYDTFISSEYRNSVLVHSSINKSPLPEIAPTEMLFSGSEQLRTYQNAEFNMTLYILSYDSKKAHVRITFF